MRVIRDMGYVKRRKRAATLTSVAGVALLGFAFWLSLSAGATNTTGVLLAYVPLLAGTLIFHLGMQQVGQWNRTPRNDEVVDFLLKPLGERYALVHFAPAGKRIVPNVLIHPGGLLAVVVREMPGEIKYANGKWSRGRAGLGRLFGLGGPQLGNPSLDAENDRVALQAFLDEHGFAVEADAAIVFANLNVELQIEEPDFPVMNRDGLEQYVRDLPIDPDFKPEDRQRAVDLLATGEELVEAKPASTRRPVKRKAA
jgi:hypothetical protein